MILYGGLVLLTLSLIVLINSFVLRILLGRKISFAQAVKLTCVAAALNKLFLTGSGYLAMSSNLKKNNFPVYESLSAFTVLELFSVLPWILSGFYFGARAGIKIPVLFITLLVLILVSVFLRHKGLTRFLQGVFGYLKEKRLIFLAVIPLSCINALLAGVYYFFLFRLFAAGLKIWDIVKIVSVSFTAGYLSLFPSGIGIKDGSLLYLLHRQGLGIVPSANIAIADRATVTIFYAFFGFLFGAGIIKEELKKKFRR